MRLERIEIDERFYLLIGQPMPIGNFTSMHRPGLDYGVKVRKVSVMCRYIGGEVRGYFLAADGLHQTLPDYIGDWPEVDDAVERALGSVVLSRARRNDVRGQLFKAVGS